MTDKVKMSDEEWRQRLSPDQYRVARKKGTEPPFAGRYVHTKGKGSYRCSSCGNPLFSSEDKYDSGTGWPSFTRPISEESVATEGDNSLFMRRTEVLCSRCEAHLGHLFDDGPKPTGQRYCMNSISLDFEEENT